MKIKNCILKLFNIDDSFAVKNLVSKAKSHIYRNLELIYNENNISNQIYIIGSGSVAIKKKVFDKQF